MATPAPGEVFGQYRIIEPLGRGGMASVFKAYEAALDRFVALKVLPAEFLHEETFAARFEREAKVVAKLEHPNIIPIFAFGIERGIPWMSMRLIGGGSLSGPLKAGQITRARAVAVIRAVADGLTYAHAHGVVHRDIKPQNILVDEHGGVYLADFGIARMVEGGAAITRTGLVSGTPQYMAPEQATGQPVDHRVDIYALGVVAYELFTGAAPFTADTPVAVLLKQVSAPIPIPPPDQVPEALLGPLMKSLAKAPDERWQTAAEFAQAIDRAMSSVTTAVGTVPPPLPTAILSPPQTLTSRAATARTHRPPPLPAPPPVQGGSSGKGLLVALLAFGFLLLAAGGVVVGYVLWPRPPVDVADGASPSPDPSRAPRPDGTQVTWPTPGPTGPTEAPSAVPSPIPSTPTFPSRAPSAQPAPPSAAPGETPAPPVALPTPSAPAPAPPSAAPLRAGTYPFRLNERGLLGLTPEGPVTLLAATFKSTKPDELEAALEFECAKGKDQLVIYELTLLDQNGTALVALKDRKGIEEKDKSTFKKRQVLPPNTLDKARSFTITFTSVPD